MNAPGPLRAIAICGPTSGGKSEIGVLVAESLDGEIINADSRQVYAGMTVGTGTPSAELQRRVPHHLYGFVDPCARYSAGAYVADAHEAVKSAVARGKLPIILGGTGLYVEVLGGTMPLDRPVADDAVRLRVRREAKVHPHEALRDWLNAIGGAEAKRLPQGDRYRTLRSLEAALALRGPSKDLAAAKARPVLALHTFLISLDADTLLGRIAQRVRTMFDEGLVDEALAVWRRCPDAPALTGLGYAEALAWFRGEALRNEAIEQTIARTRRYAKRQQTWFRRMQNAMTVDGIDSAAAAATIVALARERIASA